MRTTSRHLALCLILLSAVFSLTGCKPGKTKSAADFQACVKSCLAQKNCDLSFENNPHPIGSQCLIEQNNCVASCKSLAPAGAPSGDDMANRIPISLPPPIVGAISSPLKPGPYGAIAYSKDTYAWGASASAADKASAEKSALGFCNQRGPGCVIVDSISHACVAVATGAKNSVSWAHAPTQAAARVKAQGDCARKTGDSCAVQFWECYPDDLATPKAEGNPK